MTAAAAGTALLLVVVVLLLVVVVVVLLLLATATAPVRADERRPAVLRVPATASGRRQTGR